MQTATAKEVKEIKLGLRKVSHLPARRPTLKAVQPARAATSGDIVFMKVLFSGGYSKMQDQMYELKDNRMENLEARLMEMKKKLNDRRRISRKTRGSHPWKQFKLTLSVQEHQN